MVWSENFHFKPFPDSRKERQRPGSPFDFESHPDRHEPRSRLEPRLPFDFAVRLWLRIAPRSHPSTSPANPEARITHLWLRRLRTPSTSSRSHSRIARLRLHRLRTLRLRRLRTPEITIAKWLGFDEFDRICVYLLRNGIIYLFGSWENVKNKKKMCFLYYFQQHNKTLENIFFSRK